MLKTDSTRWRLPEILSQEGKTSRVQVLIRIPRLGTMMSDEFQIRHFGRSEACDECSVFQIYSGRLRGIRSSLEPQSIE